ncbi:MAG: cell division protein ZapE [Sphingomonadales bacterium]
MSDIDPSENETPIAAYRARLAAFELTADPTQERAVEMLDTLHLRLKHYHRDREAGVLQRLLGRGRRAPAPMGLYLYGDVGRGKSMLMDLFLDTAPVEKKRRVHFHEFMLEVHDAIHQWRGMSAVARARAGMAGDDPIPPLAAKMADQATLLCFDEFQVGDVADAMILSRLFSGLFDAGVVVVITSNIPPDRLYENGLNRGLFLPFIALIKTRLDLLHLESPTDYRLERLLGAPVYHTPLGEAAEARLVEAFLALTDGRTGEPEEITVQGRKLVIAEAARGVARATFSELCERALGAADYLALAARYHTIVLSGIPVITRDRRNVAKRFTTLIDALYDNQVRLICSAEALPHELYPQGDGGFEFARTASRLMEMQSHDYFARRETG